MYEILVVKCTDIITTSFSLDYKTMKKMRKGKTTLFVANGVEIKQYPYVEHKKKNWGRIICLSPNFKTKAGKLLLEYVLDIADSLCNEFNDVQIWVVGGNVQVKPSFDRKSSLKGFVKFFGYVSPEKLSKLYEEAAIGILPYFGALAHSSQRTKTLEYFANGLLVVSSREDLEGFYGLQHGIHCIAVESKEEMVRALREILSHPDKFTQIAERGRQFIIKRYTWEKVTKEYVKLVKELIKNE